MEKTIPEGWAKERSVDWHDLLGWVAATQGNLSEVARKVGRTYRQVRRWYNDFPELQDAVDGARAGAVDIAAVLNDLDDVPVSLTPAQGDMAWVCMIGKSIGAGQHPVSAFLAAWADYATSRVVGPSTMTAMS